MNEPAPQPNMLPRVAPTARIWTSGPFIKSPATVHFRFVQMFIELGGRMTLTIARQLIRAPYDREARVAIESAPFDQWSVDYDDIDFAVLTGKGEDFDRILDEYAKKHAFRYIREVAVVAIRHKTEDTPIGFVDYPLLDAYMNAHAKEFLPQAALEDFTTWSEMHLPGKGESGG